MSTGNIWKTKVTTGNNQDFTPCPAGNYPGRVCGLYDVGHHVEERTSQKTGETKSVDVRKLVICYELTKKQPNALPHVLGHKLTFSMADISNLYKLVTNVTGAKFAPDQEFDPLSLLGLCVMVNVTNTAPTTDGKFYANIGTVSAFPDGFPKPTFTIEPVAWSIQEGTTFPEAAWQPWIYGKTIKTLVAESNEMRGYGQTAPTVTPPTQKPAGPRPATGTVGKPTSYYSNLSDYPEDVQTMIRTGFLAVSFTNDDVDALGDQEDPKFLARAREFANPF